MGISVILVDDHRIIREGIRSILEKQPDIEVAAEAENGRVALQLVGECQPDVILMDLGMPELNGIEATRRISMQFPQSKVLILSMYSDRQMLLEALRAGAMGFLMKSCVTAKELVHAIKTVADNEKYFSPPIAESILTDYMNHCIDENPTGLSLISHREREILQLLAEGRSVKEIAFTLDLSPKTVDTHRQHIMKKLNLGNAADLIRFAIREKLITID